MCEPRPLQRPLCLHYGDQADAETAAHHVAPMAISEVVEVPIVSAELLTSGDGAKQVFGIRLDLQGTGLAFHPGDTVGIMPCNSDEDVDHLLSVAGLTAVADRRYTLTVGEGEAPPPPHIPPQSSLRAVLTSRVDIRTVPMKTLIRALAEHTEVAEERQRLLELCSRQGSSEYRRQVLQTHLTVSAVLEAFPSCRPPAGLLLRHLPSLHPRPYSVASSPLADPTGLRLIFSVVELPRQGLCTGWLARRLPSIRGGGPPVKIPIFLRRSTGFCLPDDISVPLILVGSGTGVAPFLGFLEHRAAQRKATTRERHGEIWLFYGCRHRDQDYLYRYLLEDVFLTSGVLTKLFLSFSRDHPEDSREPRYVQDSLRAQQQEVRHRLVHEDAAMYVCGDAQGMVRDVRSTMVDLMVAEAGGSRKAAQALLSQLQRSRRYVEESWV